MEACRSRLSIQPASNRRQKESNAHTIWTNPVDVFSFALASVGHHAVLSWNANSKPSQYATKDTRSRLNPRVRFHSPPQAPFLGMPCTEMLLKHRGGGQNGATCKEPQAEKQHTPFVHRHFLRRPPPTREKTHQPSHPGVSQLLL